MNEALNFFVSLLSFKSKAKIYNNILYDSVNNFLQNNRTFVFY